MSDPLDELDEFDEIRAAWRALDAPSPTAPLDEPDAATRAVVEWMRDAWRASAPADTHTSSRASESLSRLPWSFRIRLRLRRARTDRVRLAPIAAAAAIVVALAMAARSWSSHAANARPVGHDDVASRVEGAGPIESTIASSRSLVPVSLTPDRMELRSGAVRLILLTPSSESDR